MGIYLDQFILFLLVFLRVTSLFVTAPVFGHQALPVQLKVALGLFLSFVMVSFAGSAASFGSLNLISLILLAVKEVFTGATIGFSMGLIFAGVRFAGDLIGVEMGFSMATMFDPESNVQFPVVSEFLYLFLLMIFILLNGHHFVIESLHISYTLVPIGDWAISEATITKLVSITGQIFVIALKIASPLIVSMFLVNVSLGILTKVMPQMNIFGVMFSLKIGVGIIVLSATVPVITFVFKKLLSVFESSLIELVRGM